MFYRMFLQERYELEDCFGYNTLTSSSDNSLLNIPSSASSYITYSNNDGMYFRNTSYNSQIINLKNTYSSTITIEFDLIDTVATSQYRYAPILSLDNSHDDKNSIAIDGYTKTTLKISGNSGTYGSDITVTSVLGHYKISIESNSTYKLYIDGNLVGTVSSASLSTKGLSMFVGGERGFKMKNLKIKPL